MWGDSEKSWDLESTIGEALLGAKSLLDLGTGDGVFLARIARRFGLPSNAFATEGYPPNVPLARERLEPLGVSIFEVVETDQPSHSRPWLPFRDSEFEVVISRHMGYDPAEVARVLAAEGKFITQQVGDQMNLDIHRALGREREPRPEWNLDRAVQELEQAGLSVQTADECLTVGRFADMGALVYYLKGVAWEVPDFSVDRYAEPLLALHRRIEQEGSLEVGGHLFFITAAKGG
jgi:SAM-dependent methyltransferase